MSENHDMTFREVLIEFSHRDPHGYIVWGMDLNLAHKREIEMKDKEIAQLQALVAKAKEVAK